MPDVQLDGFTPIDIGEETIFISDKDNFEQYVVYQGDTDYNCVESFTIYGGSEQPFEYVTMKLVRKQLGVIAPALVDEIYAGRNRVTLIGPGQGVYVVTKCKRNSDGWTITAYSQMERLRGLVLTSELKSKEITSPYSMICTMINSAAYNLKNSGYTSSEVQKIVYCFDEDNNTWLNEMSFPKDTNVWYAIQVCALRLNCKVWMARNCLYVIDTSIEDTSATGIQSNVQFNDIDWTIYLNREGAYPYSTSAKQIEILSNITKTPTVGDDGVDVVRNLSLVKSADGLVVTATDGSAGQNVIDSIRTYMAKSYEYNAQYVGEDDAQAIADTTAERYCDAETSISFTMREATQRTVDGKQVIRWVPFFTPLTRVNRVVDYSNDVVLSTKCNFNDNVTMMQKGMLSYIETSFPEHTTKYTFGISTPTDLTQNNSVIQNAINNS